MSTIALLYYATIALLLEKASTYLASWNFLGRLWKNHRNIMEFYFGKSVGTLNIELAISQPKMVRLPQNEKQTHRLNSRLQMWPSGLTLAMTLTLNFQGQISNWLYLSQKWRDYHKTKSKDINWSQDLKCDHRVWPWPWSWPWIFKVKYGIGYISAKNGPIATKRKANTLIEL